MSARIFKTAIRRTLWRGRSPKFDAKTGAGTLEWQRYVRQPSLSFNKLDTPFVRGPVDRVPGVAVRPRSGAAV